jgi:hypothetical protein
MSINEAGRIRKLQLNRTHLFAKIYKEEIKSPCTPTKYFIEKGEKE